MADSWPFEWTGMEWKDKFAARVAEAYGRHSDKYAFVLESILAPMAEEFVVQSNRGEYFFCLNQFLFWTEKPLH
ncbi:MAG: hypothetical protein IIC78_14370 [Chloroflexi bacterium]|nr:hypothetical protein [Chloroflexota bacterium]